MCRGGKEKWDESSSCRLLVEFDGGLLQMEQQIVEYGALLISIFHASSFSHSHHTWIATTCFAVSSSWTSEY